MQLARELCLEQELLTNIPGAMPGKTHGKIQCDFVCISSVLSAFARGFAWGMPLRDGKADSEVTSLTCKYTYCLKTLLNSFS